MHGPEPPPGFVDRPPSPPPVCGPARPSTEEQQAAIAAAAAAADDVDLIGPLPAAQRLVDELRHARRPDADDGNHQRRRRRDAAGDDGGGGDRREEWMLVPPEALAPSLMSTASDGARKRARGATADKSWTRVGGAAAAATDSGSESSDAAVERRRREAAEVEAGRLRDAEMEQLAAATAGSRGGGDVGGKSLLELHRHQLAQEAADQSEKALRRELKKLKKAKKKQKKKTKKSRKKRSRKSSTSSSSGDDPNARVPFNRDADLEIRGLDSKVKQSIVAKSQASMASRFSHGGQKFL